MDPVQQNLDRSYNSFIEREEPLAFFKGLAEYLDYVFDETELKAVVDEHMAERAAGNAKVEELEKKACAEMQASKQKLLKAVKKTHVDLTLFKHLSTFPIPNFKNVIEQLEAYWRDPLSSDSHSRRLGAL